jgi:hypothetical protein
MRSIIAIKHPEVQAKGSSDRNYQGVAVTADGIGFGSGF